MDGAELAKRGKGEQSEDARLNNSSRRSKSKKSSSPAAQPNKSDKNARRASMDPDSPIVRKSLPHAATVQGGLQLLLNVASDESAPQPASPSGSASLRTPPSGLLGVPSASPLKTHKRAQSDQSLCEEDELPIQERTKAHPRPLISLSRGGCHSEQSSLSDDWPASKDRESESSSDKGQPADASNGWNAAQLGSPDSACSSRSPSLNGAQNVVDVQLNSPSPVSAPTGSSSNEGIDSKKKSSSSKPPPGSFKNAWRTLVNRSYAQRDAEFRKQFGSLLESGDRYITEYHCAYLADRYLLQQGKMYVTQRNLVFHSRMFRSAKLPKPLPFSTVETVKKEKVIRLIHNALRITLTDGRSFFFASFASRNETFNVLTRLLSAARGEAMFGNQELWTLVHSLHGAELGFVPSPVQPISGVSSITEYPDYQEFLEIAQRNGGLTLLNNLRGDNVSRCISVQEDANKTANEPAVHQVASADGRTLLNGSDVLGDESDEDSDSEDEVSALSCSYTSLTLSPGVTCCGHKALDSIGLRCTYDLSVEYVYDAVMNTEHSMSRNLYQMQRSVLANVQEFERLQPTEEDYQLMPIRPDLQDSVELVKLQRLLVYSTGFTLLVSSTVTNHEYQTVLLKRSIKNPSRIYSTLVNCKVCPSGVSMAKNLCFLRQLCLHRVAGKPSQCHLIASQHMVFKNNFQKQMMLPHLNARTDRYYKQLGELLSKEAELNAAQVQKLPRQASCRTVSSDDSHPSQPSPLQTDLRPRFSLEAQVDNVEQNQSLLPAKVQLESNAIEKLSPVDADREARFSAIGPPPSRVSRSSSSSTPSFVRFSFMAFAIILLIFVIFSQLTLMSRLERIEVLLHELMQAANKGETVNLDVLTTWLTGEANSEQS